MNRLERMRSTFLLRLPSELTRANYRSDWKSFDRHFHPWTGLEKETRILHYVDALKAEDLAPTTIKARLLRMRRFYGFLVEQGFRKDNPINLNAAPRVVDNRIPRAIDMEDFIRISKVLGTNTIEDLQTTLFVALGAYDALRIGEMARLRRCDVEECSTGLRLQIRGKCGILSSPVMWPQTKKIMTQYLRRVTFASPKNPLFASPNNPTKPLTTRTIRRRVDQVFRKAKVRAGLSVHSLRHFHAVWLHAKGVPLTQIQQRLRHTQIETTFQYLCNLPQMQTVPDSELHEIIPVELLSKRSRRGQN